MGILIVVLLILFFPVFDLMFEMIMAVIGNFYVELSIMFLILIVLSQWVLDG